MSDEALQLDPKRSALIIQDLQNDVIIEGGAFADSGAPAHATAQNVVGNVADLAAACRSAGVPVIHIWYIVEPGATGLKQNAPLFQGVKEANALVRGTWGAAPAEGLEPQDGDHVVEKMRMNGFYETRLDILLRGLGAEQLIISGAWTNMSIEHTARHGADAGYEVVVASDGTSTTGDEWQNAALELRDDQRGEGRHLRGDQDRPRIVTRSRATSSCARATSTARGSTPTPARPSPSINPATGEVVAEVPRMGAAETRRAIEAAQRALPGWRGMLAKERAAIMRRWADLMMEHQEDLAALLTTEQGKPLAESRVEVAYAASFLEWFGEEAKRVYGDTIPTYMRDRRIVVTKEPVGVTAGITPWNFPAAMPTRKAAPALGAGCTMVLKPAEQTPLTALAVMRLGEEAGLPPGVLSIVTGDAEDAPVIGGEMTSNPLVRKLGFTGSTEVGKLLMAQCAGQVKKVSLELGGNAPFIVFDDADLDAAIAGALTCKYRNSGQTCISANRILVQDGVYDDFLARLHRGRRRARRWPTASPTDVNVGPLIDMPGDREGRSATSPTRASAGPSCCSAARATSSGRSSSRRR